MKNCLAILFSLFFVAGCGGADETPFGGGTSMKGESDSDTNTSQQQETILYEGTVFVGASVVEQKLLTLHAPTRLTITVQSPISQPVAPLLTVTASGEWCAKDLVQKMHLNDQFMTIDTLPLLTDLWITILPQSNDPLLRHYHVIVKGSQPNKVEKANAETNYGFIHEEELSTECTYSSDNSAV